MNVAEYEAMYRLEDRLWWYVGMRHVAERLLAGRLQADGAAARRRILDAGCGTGGNLAWLARYGQTYGVDLSPHAMTFCRQRELTTVAQASVSRLPFPDDTFDLVTSFDVIYHLGVDDDLAALGEMYRVLTPGGCLFVRVPALPQLRSRHDAAVHTRQRYRLDELRTKLERAGFDVLRASYANSFLLPLAAAGRLAARLTAGKDAPTAGGAGEEHGAHRSDVRPVPAPLNACLRAILDLEGRLLGHVDLPLGLSAVAVGRRPAPSRESGAGARDQGAGAGPEGRGPGSTPRAASAVLPAHSQGAIAR